MPGVPKWSMQEVLFVKYHASNDVEDNFIADMMNKHFPNSKTGPFRSQGVKYCRNKFLKPELLKHNQERNWENEDHSGKIGFVLGLFDARYTHTQIVGAVERRYPGHEWVSFTSKEECVDFCLHQYGVYHPLLPGWINIVNTDPTRVIIDAVLQGYSLGDVEANMADKMNVTVDGITYILARFSDGMQKEVGLPAVADAVSGSAPKA